MSLKTVKKQKETQSKSDALLRALDQGIDDMEAGREMPVKDALNKVTELRDAKRDAI